MLLALADVARSARSPFHPLSSTWAHLVTGPTIDVAFPSPGSAPALLFNPSTPAIGALAFAEASLLSFTVAFSEDAISVLHFGSVTGPSGACTDRSPLWRAGDFLFLRRRLWRSARFVWSSNACVAQQVQSDWQYIQTLQWSFFPSEPCSTFRNDRSRRDSSLQGWACTTSPGQCVTFSLPMSERTASLPDFRAALTDVYTKAAA